MALFFTDLLNYTILWPKYWGVFFISVNFVFSEFIDVGKKQRALDALYDVIKSKKHRTWQKIHEPIMEKYLQLCVELRKSHIAKEGLYQYKNICQQVESSPRKEQTSWPVQSLVFTNSR